HSMTSIYGTTWISPIRRRPREVCAMSALRTGRADRARRVALENGGELLDEGIEAHLEARHLVGEAVVGNHRRDCGEQPDGSRHQRFRDTRCDHGERRLLHVTERGEGAHDAPDGSEQPDVGTGAADRCECRQAVLEAVDLLYLCNAHRPPRALQQQLTAGGALPQTRELAEAELEDAGHAGGTAVRFDRTIQRRQVITRPEASLEAIGFASRPVDD